METLLWLSSRLRRKQITLDEFRAQLVIKIARMVDDELHAIAIVLTEDDPDDEERKAPFQLMPKN